ncbi:MAG TPA: hypothetical protein VIZ87_10445 [Terrimicrobium sp.]|jgi:hypothetical protein
MRKLKCALSFLMVAIVARSAAEETWHLLIEPTFMHYEASWPIDGAERTVLVPARYVNGEVLPLKSNDILTLGATRDTILASAPKAASEVLATLTPRFIRDENKVIQCAVLESASPLTASAVLAPEFGTLFRETLGPEILVAVPNRFRIFVFPQGTPAFQRFSEIVIAEYDSSSYPVSKELFTLRKGKLTAVGSYR